MPLAVNRRYGGVLLALPGRGRKGAGFWDKAVSAGKAVFSIPVRLRAAIRGRRSGAPPDVRQYLAAHADTPVTGVRVCRKPIASGVKAALDVLTLGGFSAAARALNYDNVMHLWIVLDTPDGTARFDKNEVVRLLRHSDSAPESVAVSVPPGLTVGSLFKAGEAQNPSNFWLYSTTYNCQRFVMDLLRGSGLDTPELTKFVLQDTESLLSGYAKNAADAVTDLAGRADILIHGEGCGCGRCRGRRSGLNLRGYKAGTRGLA